MNPDPQAKSERAGGQLFIHKVTIHPSTAEGLDGEEGLMREPPPLVATRRSSAVPRHVGAGTGEIGGAPSSSLGQSPGAGQQEGELGSRPTLAPGHRASRAHLPLVSSHGERAAGGEAEGAPAPPSISIDTELSKKSQDCMMGISTDEGLDGETGSKASGEVAAPVGEVSGGPAPPAPASMPKINEVPGSRESEAGPSPATQVHGPTSKFRQFHDMDAITWSGGRVPKVMSHAVPGREAQLATITPESHIMELRKYQQLMLPPAVTLDMIPAEGEGEVYSEFDQLCNELLTLMTELETAVEEIALWKNSFMRQTAPSELKLQLVLLFARLFRSKSNLHEPFFELVKQTRIYSRPWSHRRSALLELEKDYTRQKHFLDIAIRKAELLQAEIDSIRGRERIRVWERALGRVIDHFPDLRYRSDDAEAALRAARERELAEARKRVAAWERLRREIREYVPAPRNAWMQKAQGLVRKFGRKFLSFFHGVTPASLERGRTLHSPEHVNHYCSKLMGGITVRSKPIPCHRRTLSAICLVEWQRVAFQHPESQNYQAPGHERHVRSNTDTAYRDIQARGARITKAIHHPLSKEEEQKGWDLIQMARINNYAPLDWEVDDEEGRFQEEADVSDVESYCDFDAEFVEHVKQLEIDQEIVAFVQENSTTNPSARATPGTGLTDAAMASQDVTGTQEVFTFKDIIELTLLHAQQAQLLQSEYETKVAQLEEQLKSSTERHHAEMQETKRKLDVALDRAQSLAHDFSRRIKEDEEKAAKEHKRLEEEERKKRAEIQHLRQALVAKTKQQEKEEKRRTVVVRAPAAQPAPLLPLPRTFAEAPPASGFPVNPVTNSKQAAKPLPPVRAPAPKKPLPPVSEPITATIFGGLNFYDRLRWFTESKLQNHQKLRAKISRAERQVNEQRLAHLRRLVRTGGGVVAGAEEDSVLPAEFMPTPHNPAWQQSYYMERLQAFGVHSPWGGKFRVPRPGRQGGPGGVDRASQPPHPHDNYDEFMNVLNLFDVAIKALPEVEVAELTGETLHNSPARP